MSDSTVEKSFSAMRSRGKGVGPVERDGFSTMRTSLTMSAVAHQAAVNVNRDVKETNYRHLEKSLTPWCQWISLLDIRRCALARGYFLLQSVRLTVQESQLDPKDMEFDLCKNVPLRSFHSIQ